MQIAAKLFIHNTRMSSFQSNVKYFINLFLLMRKCKFRVTE